VVRRDPQGGGALGEVGVEVLVGDALDEELRVGRHASAPGGGGKGPDPLSHCGFEPPPSPPLR